METQLFMLKCGMRNNGSTIKKKQNAKRRPKEKCLHVTKYIRERTFYKGPIVKACTYEFLDLIRKNFNIPERDPETILIKWYKKSAKDRVPVSFQEGCFWIVTKTCCEYLPSYYLGYESIFNKGKLYAEVWYEE